VGYDLHVTRAEDWSASDESPIALDEWLALATADPELVAMPENGEGFFAFGHPDDDAGGWFDWFEGNVYTKNPDKRLLAKMLTLASRLDAKVQGDDGEPYESPDDLDLSAEDLFARASNSSAARLSRRVQSSNEARQRPKWQFWRR
jgi:hypothetical protein